LETNIFFYNFFCFPFSKWITPFIYR
jgi:hypothetical protein